MFDQNRIHGAELSIADKIEAIERSKDLGELPAKFWPDSHSEKYLFISYSHKDYKIVFKDILLLQAAGVKVWYDRSIAPGNDWEILAEQYISNYNCVGVVFYVTPNSLKSESIKTEISYVLKRKKPYFSINSPIDVGGEKIVMSAYRMYEELGLKKDNPDTFELLKQTFNDKVIFLSTDSDIESKTDKIKEKLKQAPLFNYSLSVQRKGSSVPIFDMRSFGFEEFNFSVSRDGTASLVSVNNLDIINPPDIPEIVAIDGINYFMAKIENCAFANCRKMERVKLPDTVRIIKPNAFFNCMSLAAIDLPFGIISIGSSAFSGCSSLESCVIPDSVTDIRSWVFAGCKSLIYVYIPKSVVNLGENCFNNCEKATIFCEATSRPEGWAENWNPNNLKVVWGVEKR